MYSEQERDSHDEIKLFIHGPVVCAIGAMWCFYGYQNYPASIPAVCFFKVQTPQKLDYIVKSGKISDLQVYYNRLTKLENFNYVDFLKTYNISSTLLKFYQNNTNYCRNNVQNGRHYFEVYNKDNDDVYAYIYTPLNKVKRYVRLKMLYRTSGDIYYLCLLLLHKPSCRDKDNLTYILVRGGSIPLVCASYQQSAIAHGIVDSIDNARLTFDDMCEFGTAAQCRSHFVVLTLHGYETHAIFDNYQQRSFLYMNHIQFHNAQTIENAQVLMLQDLERLFRKSRSLFSKFGFPTPRRVPTKVEESISKWCN
jgi:hypothetical protein